MTRPFSLPTHCELVSQYCSRKPSYDILHKCFVTVGLLHTRFSFCCSVIKPGANFATTQYLLQVVLQSDDGLNTPNP